MKLKLVNYYYIMQKTKSLVYYRRNSSRKKQKPFKRTNEKNPTSLEIKNQLKFNTYRLDSFLDYSGILKSGSLSRKLKHKIEASYHSSKNVSCNKCTDLSFSYENSTPRNRYATNEWILDIGCSSAVSSHLTRCKSFRVKRWQVHGLIQKQCHFQ